MTLNLLKSLVVGGMVAGCLVAAPRAAIPAPPTKAVPFRFFEGGAQGDDLAALVWVAVGNGRAHGLVADPFSRIGFRLTGPVRGNGPTRLTARYPLDNRRIGWFQGNLTRKRVQGNFSVIGRNGRWRLNEVQRDPEAMESLAGTYVDLSTRRPRREIRITLDAATSELHMVMTRQGAVTELRGTWMAGTEEQFCMMALSGDAVLPGLDLPDGFSLTRLPVVVKYRIRGQRVNLLSPLGGDDVITTLERQP